MNIIPIILIIITIILIIAYYLFSHWIDKNSNPSFTQRQIKEGKGVEKMNKKLQKRMMRARMNR